MQLPIITGNLELLKELKEWDVGIGLLKNLIKLDISGNRIAIWPLQLENLKNLIKLNVSHNKLTDIPNDVILEYRDLNFFDASYNQLTSFPPGLYDIPLHVNLFYYIILFYKI